MLYSWSEHSTQREHIKNIFDQDRISSAARSAGRFVEGNQYQPGLSEGGLAMAAANPGNMWAAPGFDHRQLTRSLHNQSLSYFTSAGIDQRSILLRIIIPWEISMQIANLNDSQSSASDLDLLDRYWRAANYLSVGQIYLLDNALLHEPLRPEHIKPRLLGHWGTTPGLNFIYAHLNRAIRASDLNVIYVCGPGHGGPGMVANTYLEGTYSEIYPDISQDAEGLRKLFTQFSFPGGIPSHAAPETPGSIHEGGELGYALVHAYGAAFDNPDLIVACVVGDGEAETGPLAASWHSNKFLNPAHDGAVLPILHLNGYKIANPDILGRMSGEEVKHLFLGYGYEPLFVEGDDPQQMHRLMAGAFETAFDQIGAIQ